MRTFEHDIKISGVGIHSGGPVNVVINPSDKLGIFFRRTDILGSDLIPAIYNNVGETKMRNTTIGDMSSAHVQTIEHLMAALFIFGVDSAVIDIDGSETPILDGSAEQFCKIFATVKVIEKSPMRKIIVKRTVIAKQAEVLKTLPLFIRFKIKVMNVISGRRSNSFVKLSPGDSGLSIDATLVYKEKIIGTQSAKLLFDGSDKSRDEFIEKFASSRTFGKYSEWEYLKARGMARGANENNIIALNEKCDGVLNGLKYPDEFVRHKIIDCLGDMFTSGGFIFGHLESFKGSHALNNLVLRKLFSDSNNFEIIN